MVNFYFYTELFKEEKDIGGVSTENRKIFYDMLDYNIIGRKIPGMLGQGEEFAKMKVRSQNELNLMKHLKSQPLFTESIPEKKPDGRVIQVKPIVLLVAYMCGMISTK